MKKKIKVDAVKAAREIAHTRMMLATEAELLMQNYPPRVVIYGMISAAMHLSPKANLGPDEFAWLVCQALNLHTDEPHRYGVVSVEDTDDD